MNAQFVDLDAYRTSIILKKSNDLKIACPQMLPRKPSLDDALHEIGPIPDEALFMGCAEDGLPVMLNLHDPDPGPMLIVGDHASGKTNLLQVFAKYSITTHTAEEIQFAVITDQPEEWQGKFSDTPHCVGVFASQGSELKRLARSISMWIDDIGRSKQSVLVMMDGYENILHWDKPMQEDWLHILKYGTGKRVWPIVTIHPVCSVQMRKWLEMFRLRIFSHDLIQNKAEETDPIRDLGNIHPAKNPWFSMKEYGNWINFWIPDLG